MLPVLALKLNENNKWCLLISWSEIKIGAGGCELFVVDLEGKWEGDRKWTLLSNYLLPYSGRKREAEGRFLISRKLLM